VCGISTSVNTNFNKTVLTSRDEFQQIRMRPNGQQVGLPHPPATPQITVHSVELFISISTVECFHAVWNNTFLQSFNVFYGSKNVHILRQINFHALCFFRFFLMVFHMLYELKKHFNGKEFLTFLMVLSTPINHKR
jgi:hypothetical protein